MSSFLLQILQRTPPWVGLLFLVLIGLGVMQSRTRSLPRTRVFVFPAVMLGLSLFGVWSSFGAAPISLTAWGGGILLAILLNRILGLPAGVAYSPASRRFTVPGSWLPLALMMAIFFTRYAITVTIAISPLLREAAMFAGAVSLVYGLASGTFFARALHIVRTGK
ncbi:MAG TPA: DUF6622 family protein [Burkholderiales bacterium]